jgi:hypothetical protein
MKRAQIGIDLKAGRLRPRILPVQCHETAWTTFINPPRGALGRQHVDDLLSRLIAEQLALVLFVKADAVSPNQIDEAVGGVGAERIPREPRVGARKSLEAITFQIGEIAAATTRDADFFGAPFTVIDEQHPQPALARH